MLIATNYPQFQGVRASLFKYLSIEMWTNAICAMGICQIVDPWQPYAAHTDLQSYRKAVKKLSTRAAQGGFCYPA